MEISDGDTLMRRLKDRGYVQITLLGLTRLGARLRDGTACDAVLLLVEEDAAFLADACREAEDVVNRQRPARHSVYLEEGCFEFVTFLSDDAARMRVGEFFGPFDPTSDEGVRITVDEFLTFWRSVAWQLARAAKAD